MKLDLRWLSMLDVERGAPTGPPQWVRAYGQVYHFAHNGHAFAMVADVLSATPEARRFPYANLVVRYSGRRPDGVVSFAALRDWLGRTTTERPAYMRTPDGRYSSPLNRSLLRRALGPLKVDEVLISVAPASDDLRPFVLYPLDRRWIVGVMPLRDGVARGAPVLRLRRIRAGRRAA